jgi:hypothetical protein
MKNRSLCVMLVLTVAAAAVLACTATVAYAAPPSPAILGLNVYAPGNGSWFGNQYPGTSPLIATYPQIMSSGWRGWYNQGASFLTTPTFLTQSYQPIPLSYLGYSYNGSAFTSITATPHRAFWNDGIYSFDATGALVLSSYEGTASFGIDSARPTSTSNVLPVYDTTATIAITASDTASGPEYIVFSFDGAPDYAYALSNPNALNLNFWVLISGPHTLRWFTIDNAGNHEYTHMASFVVNATGYVPVLGKPKVSVKKKVATFTGSVTPAATSRTVVLTVQRKSGKWKGFATYSVTVPKYAGTYALKKSISKKGTYQVKAAEGTGASVWSKGFAIK